MNRFISLHIDTAKQDFAIHPSTGFLIMEARATRTGIFDYRDAKGNIVREFRSPEEVFHPDSLESLKFAPITRHHPSEMVTVDNIKLVQTGMVGENVHQDGEFVRCPLVITDKAEIKRIKDAKDRGEAVELSCGYDAETIPMPGEHPTEGKYDAIQKNIRYNHLSAVDRGRAGREVKLILDEIETLKREVKLVKIKKDAIVVGAFRMDTIEGEIADESMPIFDRFSGKLDEAVAIIGTHEDAISAGKKEKDELQGKYDQLEADNKKLKEDASLDINSPKIQALIKAKQDLDMMAEALEVKTAKEDGTDKGFKDLKIDIITAASGAKFDAEGKSDDYLDARIEQIAELIVKGKKADDKDKMKTFIKKADKDVEPKKSARQEFLDAAGEGGTLFKEEVK
ncbi:DUF2213 domain-containing protein [Candidatus Pacearchaeota archaeon]|nr:DUF2213 domain-containing protein [Candidatus Pacearchaeota archaeon]